LGKEMVSQRMLKYGAPGPGEGLVRSNQSLQKSEGGHRRIAEELPWKKERP